MAEIIDAHVHCSIYRENAKDLESAFEMLQKEMRSNGVDYAIVIPDNVEGLEYIADMDKAIDLIGGNKSFFLIGSPQVIQKGPGEIDKYTTLLTKGTIVGLKFYTGHDPYYPTDNRCLPYYKVCQEKGAPVLFHTGENSGDTGCSKYNDPEHIVEIAKSFPELKVIISHFFWPKLDYCYEITKNIDNVYFELAALADKEVIDKSGGINKIKEVLVKTINDRPDKVIYGTDWPMCKMDSHIDLVKSLNLEKEVEDKIFLKNSVKAYNLKLSF